MCREGDRGIQGNPGPPGQPGLQGSPGKPVSYSNASQNHNYKTLFFRACLDLLENREMLDLLVLRVTLVHLALLAYRGLQVIKVPQAQRDLQD